MLINFYTQEEDAAKAFDRAAIVMNKLHTLNFDLKTYSKELQDLRKLSKEEFIASCRRQSHGFCRGKAKYRGVSARPTGRWEARIR